MEDMAAGDKIWLQNLGSQQAKAKIVTDLGRG